jgi:cellulose synthase/poly-beta-1,6-N-acetylglucosamine synthase-like glycosyltransferase
MIPPLILLVLAIPAVLATGYLLLLTLLSARTPAPVPGPSTVAFDLVVPAHDEENGIARTVASLRDLDWPADRFRVLVVADNCCDATAERAREAGATVIVRTDPERRGKGYALNLAFERVLQDGFANAAVVVDADSLASRNMLGAFAARLRSGAAAVQARYGVLNVEDSWRTRLMAIAFAMFHDVRSLGRSRLGTSCGLRGNGMCFRVDVLRRVPHDAFSIVEDLEYGIRLGLAGIRVDYADEAEVRGEMAAGGRGVGTQRRRWEGGRMKILRAQGAGLLQDAVRRRDRVLLDLAFDLAVPPLSWVAAYSLAGLVGAGAAAAAGMMPAWTVIPWAASCAFLVAHVLRGVSLSGTGWKGLLALAFAPAYVGWKVVNLIASPRQTNEWVRTSRTKEGP